MRDTQAHKDARANLTQARILVAVTMEMIVDKDDMTLWPERKELERALTILRSVGARLIEVDKEN